LPIGSKKKMTRVTSLLLLSALFALLPALARAQQMASTSLPEAPDQQAATVGADQATSVHTDPQTKRILGIFPNFRAVSAETHPPAQSVKEKFVTATQDSFDYSSYVVPALIAGDQQATNATPEFHQGVAGYGRYFWHTFVDQTSENYWVEFIMPTLTREDNRYYTMGPGGGDTWKRVGYALSRAVVTRNDNGRDTFNASEVVGAGAAAGISNLYYPTHERTFSNTADKWSENVGIDAASFVMREFWPDINHALFHGSKPMATH
jgi:hypothetical protein